MRRATFGQRLAACHAACVAEGLTDPTSPPLILLTDRNLGHAMRSGPRADTQQLTPACDACGDVGCGQCPETRPADDVPYDALAY